MKSRSLIAALAGIGVLGSLGTLAVHEALWHPPAAAVEQSDEQPDALPLLVMTGPTEPSPASDATAPPQPAETGPTASDPAGGDPAGGDAAGVDLGPEPTYEQQTAARDRAAQHSARSR